MTTSIWFWIAFHVGVFIAIFVDLAQFKHRNRDLTMRAAARRTLIWILLSLGFNLLVWKIRGPDDALDFLTGYVIEYSLSVDNIFVFVVIFAYFRVPPMAQHRVLVWGIVGALIMRGLMILFGVTAVARFHWVLYIFGIFLIISAVRMFFGKTDEKELRESLVMRLAKRWIRVTPQFHGEHFKARVEGRWMLTPLALTLVVIESMDLIFAVDSIPAVFAITRDPFIVYTSNICAILGLRSLYFLLARLMDRFIYLKTGLAFVLGFVGIKMISSDAFSFSFSIGEKAFAVQYPGFHIPNWLSLLVIAMILAITISISLYATRDTAAPKRPLPK